MKTHGGSKRIKIRSLNPNKAPGYLSPSLLKEAPPYRRFAPKIPTGMAEKHKRR